MRKPNLAALIVLLSAGSQALAQDYNGFFGSSMPEGANPGADAAQAAATRQLPAGGGDYTDDEKRMQKKYRASVRHAQKLVAKAEALIEQGKKGENDKLLKKGKILKEIGTKRLEELKVNNPFPDAGIDFGGAAVTTKP